MAGKLTGKIALITGGSTGIGLATAKRFVADGATVFITGRRQAELDKAVAEIGGNCVFRRIPAGQSDTSQPVIPAEASHPFRGNPATPE